MRQIVWYLVAIACAGGNVAWRFCKTDLVISMGVRTWNTVTVILSVLSAITLCIASIHMIQSARKETGKEEKSSAPEIPKQMASLSMKGQLSTDTIAGLLTDAVNGKNGDWAKLKLLFMECREQLYKMDRYQEKLHILLVENDAQKLANTEEIVTRVEQYMLRNTRKICNYVQIYDSSDEEGLAKITKQTQECLQDNRKQLEHARDLLAAIADFLNRQGQDDSALETMEIYKNMMLESIEQEEKNV